MTRMDALTAKRRDMRYESAQAAIGHILSEASRQGIEITLIGSLASGDFRIHSDIDLLVRGPVDSRRRLIAERLVADGMRGRDIPYDLVFEHDLTEERLQEMLNEELGADQPALRSSARRARMPAAMKPRDRP